MALGPRLDLRQSQSLTMTPQLQQAIKLLALSNLELETFVTEAVESNPLLESGDADLDDGPAFEPPPAPAESATSDELMLRGAGEADAPLDIDPAALDRDRDTGDWSAAGTGGADAPEIDERGSEAPTLAAHLEAQVGTITSDPQLAFVARHLIGLLDEAGYLDTALRDVAAELGVALVVAERALALIQSLEPTGVGARSLAECLALQAKEADRYDPCMARLLDNLELLGRGAFAQIRRICEVDEEDFADMLAELRGYDPKPGLKIGEGSRAPITPDILIAPLAAGGWEIALNPATLPRLVVNRAYYVEVRSGCTDKAAKAWLSDKLADANWLIKALDQRQKTILKVTAEIVKQQEGFFRRGVSALRPLTLRNVAEAIEMHESTISRVTSNKYLHCPRGTFELKYFFTSGVARVAAVGDSGDGQGEGAVSAEAVKAQIRSLCSDEHADDVLSDDKLVELLRDKGFDLARRTVAKYREAIGIGSSVQRRRQKKLARVA